MQSNFQCKLILGHVLSFENKKYLTLCSVRLSREFSFMSSLCHLLISCQHRICKIKSGSILNQLYKGTYYNNLNKYILYSKENLPFLFDQHSSDTVFCRNVPQLVEMSTNATVLFEGEYQSVQNKLIYFTYIFDL